MNKIAEQMNKSQDLLKTLVFRLELLMIIHYFSQSSTKILVIIKENSVLISVSLLGDMIV